MNSQPVESASPTSPIDDFSQCHVGILSQLQALGGLPALLDAAAQARRVAAKALQFFREVVHEHHAEEETELFPAVLASAAKGDERAKVQGIAARLTDEHRRIEAAWSKLEPGLEAAAKGRDAALDGAAVARLVQTYQAHARYEEEVFLPLASAILGRNSNHMAALGLSLHLRHAMPQVMARFGSRV